MSDTDLKPCPFCAGKAKIVQDTHRHLAPPVRFGVICEGQCGVYMDCREWSEANAARAWNHRPEALGTIGQDDTCSYCGCKRGSCPEFIDCHSRQKPEAEGIHPTELTCQRGTRQ